MGFAKRGKEKPEAASDQRPTPEKTNDPKQPGAAPPHADRAAGSKPAPGKKRRASDAADVALDLSARWRQVVQLGERLLASPPDPTSIEDTLRLQRQIVEETAVQLLGGQAVLWVAGKALNGFGLRPDPLEQNATEPPSPLMRRALAARQLWCSPTPEAADGADPGCPPEAEAASAAAAAAPLLAEAGAAVLGVLQIDRPGGPPLDLVELQLLDGLAFQTALALQAGNKTAIERWRIQQLDLVRKVSAQIAALHDLDELARQVTQLILDTFDYYYVAIFTLEPGQSVLHFRDSAGPLSNEAHHPYARQRPAPEDSPPSEGTQELAPGEPVSPALTVHLGEGIIGQVALTGQEIIARDVSREARFRFTEALPETRSEFALPLKIEDRVLGVLDVQSDQLDDFQETDRLVLQALADNIAIAVEEANLYQALNRRAEQLAAIFEVSNAITSILDLDELLQEVVSLIHNRFGYPWVHLFSVHPGRRKIFYEAGTGSISQYFHEQGYALDLDDPVGLIPWAVRQAETLLVNDVLSEPRYRPSPLPPDETRSELVVPLIFGGDVLGVLDVQSDRPEAFGVEDRFLFEALADNVAVALRNAFLYRSESWRRQVADSLREVAGLLSADVDLDQVLDAILTETERTLPCDLAAIWLLDDDALDANPDEIDPVSQLRLAAVRGPESASLVLESGLTLAEILDNRGLPFDPGELEAPDPAGLLAEALDADEPLIRSDASPHDPLGEMLSFPAGYSAIAAPLRAGDQRLGLLSLVHHTSGRYGAEARAMTAAFASYAAVAIENTRLYEAAHEQAWIATVLLQMADATQSITNLNELLVTVTQITPMLVGVKACALYLRDEDDCFVPAAASGLSSEQQLEFERWRFAPGDMPALDQLLIERRPMVLTEENVDPLLAGIIAVGNDPKALFDAEMLVLVPLMARGEVLGAFVIDYSSDLRNSDNLSEHLEALFDERLAILQGIAHQTAIAVENIRLIKAQKEEAYVSVALLQVAQTVVSSNDLNETLGSIVRITPILVGVKRSLLFLWDGEYNVFRLAQAYGVPRSAEGSLYPPGAFPLLDAVQRTNRLTAYPLTAPGEEREDVPEAWTDFLPPEPEEMDALMESESCLLLGLPLSVKNNLLGVLLVEEPDPTPAEILSSSSANRRLREKRLEIITGISQQAALAIQNDQLQREMVERERLEQEMQLARGIQLTFLPNQVPELDGWEMNVLWRTAREVGGDFYDYFDLPGNRLGMVIADVADKGMPAALFMTLIRTLVRAAVYEISSPADVLGRVNDLLVPDAQQGMFVTLVYAVLELDTGVLTYTNAGHNPPLVWRRDTEQIERLEKTGMALGVLEGSRTTERTVHLEPGDYLVLYTDGITETFSPDGEMFGEAHLKRILKETAQGREDLSSQELLAAIDEAVANFLGLHSRTDDLTLLVLRRLQAPGTPE